jgi:hypothetical protein
VGQDEESLNQLDAFIGTLHVVGPAPESDTAADIVRRESTKALQGDGAV